VLLFNGQIYNTSEIIEQHLQNEVITSALDTELIYKLIEKYGWGFISKIQGMFSIALYNKNENIIKLYRDASGQKNLYYYYDGSNIIFSSEIKSILTHNIDKQASKNSVEISCTIGYIPGVNTLFKNIYKLLPSEVITYNLNSRKLLKEFYRSVSTDSYNRETILSNVIGDHLQSQYKVSLNLSGGLDSSLILHEASKLDYKLDTYTTYFDIDKKHMLNEDAMLARRLSKDYGTNHNEILITKSSYYDNLVESYSLVEEPNYNISLPVYLQTAKYEGVNGDKKRVILSGDGGDEVFGGYSYYLANNKYDFFIRLLTPYIFNKLKNNKETKYKYQNISHRWLSFKNMGNSFLSNAFEASDVLEYVDNIYNSYIKLYGVSKNSIHNMMMLDRIIWLASENFIRSDKLFMSQSLELRSPLSYMPLRNFFDRNLSRNEYINKENNKLFLRKKYQDELPNYILNKPKSGWRAPVDIWYDKKYKDLFLDVFSEVENNNNLINWTSIKKTVYKNHQWPGKHMHLYLSLAILSNKYKLNI
jgi:asparagine synthase (glutamine-hydrolysing)